MTGSRRHQRLSVPVEVTYDEHTPDVIENQAPACRTRQTPPARPPSRPAQHDLAQNFTRTFADVTLQHFRPQTVPRPTINRLNSHYAPALTLARLILTNETLELDTGSQNSNGCCSTWPTCSRRSFTQHYEKSLDRPNGSSPWPSPRRALPRPRQTRPPRTRHLMVGAGRLLPGR